MKSHPLYQLAYTAYRNLSHDPERRAESFCREYDEYAAKVTTLNGDTNRLNQLARVYLASLSNTASAMIVGPARFPTERNQKRQRWAQNHLEKYLSYITYLEKRAEREAQPPALTLAQRLEQARAEHAKIKATPPSQRRHSFELAYATKAVADLEKQAAAVERLKPDNLHPQPFRSDDFRVWFTFDGKPDAETINLLKSHAFKWTPSKGHWGRKMTPNALYAAQVIANKITKKD